MNFFLRIYSESLHVMNNKDVRPVCAMVFWDVCFPLCSPAVAPSAL